MLYRVLSTCILYIARHIVGLCMCIYMYIPCCRVLLCDSKVQCYWLMLPSNQTFYRLIGGFGMGVADCEVGQ